MHSKISVTEQQTLENINIAASPSGRCKTDSIVILVPPIPMKTRRREKEMGKDANKDRERHKLRGDATYKRRG